MVEGVGGGGGKGRGKGPDTHRPRMLLQKRWMSARDR